MSLDFILPRDDLSSFIRGFHTEAHLSLLKPWTCTDLFIFSYFFFFLFLKMKGALDGHVRIR